MYVATVFIWLTVLVLVSPAIWIVWWGLATLGEKVSGSHAHVYAQRRRAA
jgi:hypothetical protein